LAAGVGVRHHLRQQATARTVDSSLDGMNTTGMIRGSGVRLITCGPSAADQATVKPRAEACRVHDAQRACVRCIRRQLLSRPVFRCLVGRPTGRT